MKEQLVRSPKSRSSGRHKERLFSSTKNPFFTGSYERAKFPLSEKSLSGRYDRASVPLSEKSLYLVATKERLFQSQKNRSFSSQI